jgi:hypothetical protein
MLKKTTNDETHGNRTNDLAKPKHHYYHCTTFSIMLLNDSLSDISSNQVAHSANPASPRGQVEMKNA